MLAFAFLVICHVNLPPQAIAARHEEPQKPLELPNAPKDEPVVEGLGREEVPAEETRAKVALAA